MTLPVTFTKILGVIALSLFISQISIAQDSPLQADPGTPPPPQGWKVGGPEGVGIHMPGKAKKATRLRRQGLSSQGAGPSIDAPAAEGEHPNVKGKKNDEPVKILAISGGLGAQSINSIFLKAAPEYAHGIPGSLKNALDWLVSV